MDAPTAAGTVRSLRVGTALRPVPSLGVSLGTDHAAGDGGDVRCVCTNVPAARDKDFGVAAVSVGSTFRDHNSTKGKCGDGSFTHFRRCLGAFRRHIRTQCTGTACPTTAKLRKAFGPTGKAISGCSTSMVIPTFLTTCAKNDSVGSPLSVFPDFTHVLPG